MTERQADQAWVEANRAENECRANPVTYRGVPLVWNLRDDVVDAHGKAGPINRDPSQWWRNGPA